MNALGIVPLLLMATVLEGGEWTRLGGEFTIGEQTPIRKLLEDPGQYHNRKVKISGIIASVCNEEGCFVEVVPKDGSGDGIVANFQGLTYAFPLDCAGREAIIEGLFFQKIYPAARVSHWQHHSYRRGRKVPEYALIMRMASEAAKIGGSRAEIPAPAEIKSALPRRIDLDLVEFEDEGFGIAKKQIGPGAAVQQHAMGKARKMIVCLEGSVTVHTQGSGPVKLSAGEMAFIPPATAHEIRNEGEEDAGYISVYARTIEIEKEEMHDH